VGGPELDWNRTDDNFDNNRADMERYEAVCTHCLVQIKHLQTRYFAGYGDTRRKILVTDLKTVQCGLESHRPYY
jgi:hypothetical protein